MKRFALLALPLAIVACGDNNDENRPIDAAIDTATIDTPNIDAAVDAAIDAPIDAPAITYSGTLSLLEAAVLNPTGAPTQFFGQGLQVGISFASSDTAIFPGPTLEETPGSPLDCKLWEYTAAQAQAVSVGLNEGPVQVTSTVGTAPPMFPACTFTAGVGYTCPHTATFSTGGTIGAGPQAGLLTLTDADTTFNAGNTSNRYVNISGAAMAGNNGTFPIVALGGANTIVYANPGGAAETLPVTSGHVNLAGVGPTPSAPDPGFLADDNDTSFALTPGGDMNFAAFTMTTGAGTVGDDFVLSPATVLLLNNMPRIAAPSAPITLGCDVTSCAAGSSGGMLINIVTTDTSVAGLSPFAMPPPTTKRINIRCSKLGNQTQIVIPAAFAAKLADAGIKRIQTTVIRPTLLGLTPATAISGHAIVGFTTVP